MELFLADYDPLLSFFHPQSARITNADYETHAPVSGGEDVQLETRREYSRLFEEMEFLVQHWDPSQQKAPLLVVQNSYPNAHYVLLAQLFPTLTIHLWGTGNLLTPMEFAALDNLTVYDEDLSENRALELYREREDVFFCCYLTPEPGLNNKEIYNVFWITQHAYQANLVRAINPQQASLTFCLPLADKEGPEFYTYFRGFLTPQVLTSAFPTVESRMCRCLLVYEQNTHRRVRCNYAVEWFDGVLNFWNLVAQKGKLLHNPLTKSSYVTTNEGILYCGAEICRVLDIVDRYLRFARITDGDYIEHLVLEKVLALLAYLDKSLSTMGMGYSLVEHSLRYQPQNMIESLTLTPDAPLNVRESIVLPDTLRRARALLESAEETVTDLSL